MPKGLLKSEVNHLREIFTHAKGQFDSPDFNDAAFTDINLRLKAMRSSSDWIENMLGCLATVGFYITRMEGVQVIDVEKEEAAP